MLQLYGIIQHDRPVSFCHKFSIAATREMCSRISCVNASVIPPSHQSVSSRSVIFHRLKAYKKPVSPTYKTQFMTAWEPFAPECISAPGVSVATRACPARRSLSSRSGMLHQIKAYEKLIAQTCKTSFYCWGDFISPSQRLGLNPLFK